MTTIAARPIAVTKATAPAPVKTVAPAQAEAMHAALDKAGVENKLQMFAGAEHDFYVKGDPAKTDAYCTQAMAAMVAWFENHLKR